MSEESADRNIITLLTSHLEENLLEELRCIGLSNLLILSVSPGSRIINLVNLLDTGINCLVVHVKDILSLSTVGLLNLISESLNSSLNRDNIGNLEEACLHDHVDT